MIRTDHKSIQELLQQTIQTPEQQRYVRKLIGYHFRIDYKTEKSNLAADALSRLHAPTLLEDKVAVIDGHSFSIISTPIVEWCDILRQKNLSCSDLQSLHEQFREGKLGPNYSIHQGILMFLHRYYISRY